MSSSLSLLFFCDEIGGDLKQSSKKWVKKGQAPLQTYDLLWCDLCMFVCACVCVYVRQFKSLQASSFGIAVMTPHSHRYTPFVTPIPPIISSHCLCHIRFLLYSSPLLPPTSLPFLSFQIYWYLCTFILSIQRLQCWNNWS